MTLRSMGQAGLRILGHREAQLRRHVCSSFRLLDKQLSGRLPSQTIGGQSTHGRAGVCDCIWGRSRPSIGYLESREARSEAPPENPPNAYRRRLTRPGAEGASAPTSGPDTMGAKFRFSGWGARSAPPLKPESLDHRRNPCEFSYPAFFSRPVAQRG